MKKRNIQAIDKVGVDRMLPVKILVKSVLQQMFVLPVAALYYKVRIQKKGVYHLIICGHIGDFLYTMGYADAFQVEYGLEKLRVVSLEKFRGLAGCYPKKGRSYCAVSETWLQILCIANRSAAGQLLFAGFHDCLVVEPANGFVQGFSYAKEYQQLNLKDCICQGVLKLKPGSRFQLPALVKKNLRADVTCIGKILLCPYAQAVSDQHTKPFFRELAKRLAQKRYQVEMNAPNGQQFLPGVRVVSDSLDQMFEKLHSYQAVIGIRSGLLDLAVFAGCRVGVLYPAGYELIHFYDLRHAALCVQERRQTSSRSQDKFKNERIDDADQDLFQYEWTGDMERDLAAVIAWIG